MSSLPATSALSGSLSVREAKRALRQLLLSRRNGFHRARLLARSAQPAPPPPPSEWIGKENVGGNVQRRASPEGASAPRLLGEPRKVFHEAEKVAFANLHEARETQLQATRVLPQSHSRDEESDHGEREAEKRREAGHATGSRSEVPNDAEDARRSSPSDAGGDLGKALHGENIPPCSSSGWRNSAASSSESAKLSSGCPDSSAARAACATSSATRPPPSEARLITSVRGGSLARDAAAKGACAEKPRARGDLPAPAEADESGVRERDDEEGMQRRRSMEGAFQRLLGAVYPQVVHADGWLRSGKRSLVVAGYSPIGSELDSMFLLSLAESLGHVCALPSIEEKRAPLTFRQWFYGMPLVPGKFNIPAPAADCRHPVVEPDVLIVPLLGFDRVGRRLGYGGGFYDRTLDDLRRRRGLTEKTSRSKEKRDNFGPVGPISARLHAAEVAQQRKSSSLPLLVCGIAFDCQEVDEIPTEVFDEPLDCLLLERELRVFSPELAEALKPRQGS
ncbi:5-formyltetrahydrofolate cyclo-ligase [Besnoitia besnoiti]|uniref:5-formyltetrahydrofolate cyclo-ligase n=1 Tax=Besnoitia besnoiti TaxID=94643 RepID=A0A2A9M8Q9_BESBE|nr:5-formyltetrahydrofolate cyclo-ligase [Besnoitia besnoiti]PFH31782.1 5-formyltetrahydrofolate cyclo-ligase [Besnoitia besnoiti]